MSAKTKRIAVNEAAKRHHKWATEWTARLRRSQLRAYIWEKSFWRNVNARGAHGVTWEIASSFRNWQDALACIKIEKRCVKRWADAMLEDMGIPATVEVR